MDASQSWTLPMTDPHDPVAAQWEKLRGLSGGLLPKVFCLHGEVGADKFLHGNPLLIQYLVFILLD